MILCIAIHINNKPQHFYTNVAKNSKEHLKYKHKQRHWYRYIKPFANTILKPHAPMVLTPSSTLWIWILLGPLSILRISVRWRGLQLTSMITDESCLATIPDCHLEVHFGLTGLTFIQLHHWIFCCWILFMMDRFSFASRFVIQKLRAWWSILVKPFSRRQVVPIYHFILIIKPLKFFAISRKFILSLFWATFYGLFFLFFILVCWNLSYVFFNRSCTNCSMEILFFNFH